MNWRMPRWTGRMESKLSVVFVFLIALPIGALTLLSAQRYSHSIEDNTIAYVSKLSDSMMGKLDDYMQDMQKISIIPSYLGEIKDGLKMSNEFYRGQPDGGGDSVSILPSNQQRTIDIRKKIGNSIYFLNNIKSGTNTVYLFDAFGHVYYSAKVLDVRSDLSAVYPEWKKVAANAHGTPVLLSTQEVTPTMSGKRYVFTVVREIIDPANFDTLGIIAVDANIGVIEDIVMNLDNVTHGTTLITDDGGRVIYDSEKKYLGQKWSRQELLAKMPGSQGSFHHTENGQPVLTIYKQSEATGWRVLITIPENHLMEDATKTRNFTIVTAIVIMAFALLISLVLVFAITRPLRSLVRHMKEVQNGNMNVFFPARRRDEIGLAGSAFNRMIDRMKTLIQDIYQVEQRKKEAELESLQHQINPHFIYNTLESIRMTAVLNDDKEVGDMTQLLGKLLRYSFHAGLEFVPIDREWRHLRMYVTLLNYRYGNRFVLDLPDPRETEGLQVMKLLFQPIVENSVYHGLDDSQAGMRIRIRYRPEGTDDLFDIADDGSGMDVETLANLQAALRLSAAEAAGQGGIGLRNVNERLKLRYGEAYGLTVDSEPGRGTTVTVRLPHRRKGGDQA
ncbi:sensor histidine kinase [Cohnella zeiphila]|uniref:cache domain-containing sensor histidine kinase n=1 Tax=Cohnella zeiphila TaxID=2761120 RepID=UPI0030805115